jgi:hypothetical protein
MWTVALGPALVMLRLCLTALALSKLTLTPKVLAAGNSLMGVRNSGSNFEDPTAMMIYDWFQAWSISARNLWGIALP